MWKQKQKYENYRYKTHVIANIIIFYIYEHFMMIRENVLFAHMTEFTEYLLKTSGDKIID